MAEQVLGPTQSCQGACRTVSDASLHGVQLSRERV